MVSLTILGGGYDTFIATYIFNTVTLTLTLLGRSPISGSNPSWVALNPANRSLLYTVNENYSGYLQSYAINPTGLLSSVIDSIPTNGDLPAHVAVLSGGTVSVMNYQSGNGRIVATTSQQSRFDTSAPTISFPKPASGVSHPHQTVEYNNQLFIPDLGADTIHRLAKSGNAYTIQGSLPQPKGSGPRHIAIYNDRLFALHELSSTLSVQSIPPAINGASTTYASVSILPPNPPSGALWAAAELLIPPPLAGCPTYIYASNRNTGTQSSTGDSIAIFEHVNKGLSNEGLSLVKQVFTGLNQIRGMQFGNPGTAGEAFLVASGVAGTAGVLVLKRTDCGRDLQIVAQNRDVPTRTSFVWL